MSSSSINPIGFHHLSRTSTTPAPEGKSDPTDWWQQLNLPNIHDSKAIDHILLEDPDKDTDSFDLNLDTFSYKEESRPNTTIEALSMAADTFETNRQKAFLSIGPDKLLLLQKIWALLPEDLELDDPPNPFAGETEAPPAKQPAQSKTHKRLKLMDPSLSAPQSPAGNIINLLSLEIGPVTPPNNGAFTGKQNLSPPGTPKSITDLNLLKKLQPHLSDEQFNKLVWNIILNSAPTNSVIETIDPSTFKNVDLDFLNTIQPHLPAKQFKAVCWNTILDSAPKNPPLQTKLTPEPMDAATFWNSLLNGDFSYSASRPKPDRNASPAIMEPSENSSETKESSKKRKTSSTATSSMQQRQNTIPGA